MKQSYAEAIVFLLSLFYPDYQIDVEEVMYREFIGDNVTDWKSSGTYKIKIAFTSKRNTRVVAHLHHYKDLEYFLEDYEEDPGIRNTILRACEL